MQSLVHLSWNPALSYRRGRETSMRRSRAWKWVWVSPNRHVYFFFPLGMPFLQFLLYLQLLILVEKGVMQKSLSENLFSIFKTASHKFNILLCCQDLSQLKFDNFLDIVEMSNRFRKFGRHHFGNSCGEVAISLEKQTYLYFGRYHQERMEELKMFLENEVFTLCPVPLQFTLFDLQVSSRDVQ